MKRHGWRLTWCGAWTWAALAASPAAAQSVATAAPKARPAADAATMVQLAWMADAALFPYALTARVGGAGLVVAGYVPNERIQWRAVRVAQGAMPLHVIDELKLNPRLPVPPMAWGDAVELERQAADTLTAALGARANNVVVFGGPAGRVTLTGTVGSAEDRLLASACLRRLPQCGSVDNRLTAAAAWGTTATAALPPIVRSMSAGMQTAEPPLVMATALTRAGVKSSDGPALPEPTPAVTPIPTVLRDEAAASASAPKRQPPPATLLTAATRTAGEPDLVLPAIVLHPAPALVAPAADIEPPSQSARKPPAAAADDRPALHLAEPEAPTPPRIIGAEQLRTALDAACHGLASDLHVQLADDRAIVSLRLRTMLDWEWVRGRIRAVTEAAGLTVTFNVTVKP